MSIFGAVILGVVMGVGPALAGGSSNEASSRAAEALRDAFPGVQVQRVDGAVRAIHGQAMTVADSPAQAAEWWLAEYGDVFGIDGLDLRIERTHDVGLDSLRTIFAYQQYMEGIPVEFGMARMVVANGSVNTVTLVTGKLASPPANGFAPDQLSDENALEVAAEAYEHLSVWSAPEMVIYTGDSDGISLADPVRTWKIRGENTLQGDDFEAWSLFVNAADGSIVFVRDEVYHTDVTGTAHGNATPFGPPDGMYPDDAQNLPADFDLEDVQLSIVGGAVVNANDDGSFVIPNAGAGAVSVQGKLIGPWVNVIDDTGVEHVISATITPPGPWDALFNPTPTEVLTAQVNAMIHSTNSHDFFKDRQPGFNGLNQIQAHVNQNSTCNAFYSGNTINFYKKGGGCPNTAYSSVVAHEYGHYIVNQLGLAQNAFGEGTGDITGDLMYDDPMTGRDFFCEGCILRNPVAANKQFPCNGAIHDCGMVLSGTWWDINLNLTPVLGDQAALEYVQQIWTDWMIITIGQHDSTDAIGPTSAIEVLEVADDDGNPGTPGPYDDEICAAFDKHGIECAVPGVDCSAVRNFGAKCTGGNLRVGVVMVDSSNDGDVVTIQVDNNAPVNLTITGGRATYQLPGQGGTHTVSLLYPADCKPDKTVDCQ